MAGKTPGSMEEKLLTPELNTPLKLARLNEMPDGPVDMATVSGTIVWNLAKMKAIKRGVTFCSVTSDSVDDSSKRRKFACALRGVQLGLQDRSIELEMRISHLKGEKNSFEENLTREREAFQLELEKEREAAALKLKEVRAERVAEMERLVTASATSRNNHVGKLYQLRYTKAKFLAFSKENYEEKEIMDEEEVEEMEDGLNVAEKTAADNQETIDQEIKSSRLRFVDLEGLLEVEKKSSAELKKELDVAREREDQTILYNAEYAEEYEALISQYEDRLDDNVKLSLKLEEAKIQVENMTATILSRDLALNKLTSELAELKEKCSIHALNEQLLKKEIDLDTTRTDLAVFEADFKKLNSSIAGKDLKLRNSAQIRNSLVARLDRLKADLRRLKGREAQSRADLAEVQAKNKSLVDDLAHTRGNLRDSKHAVVTHQAFKKLVVHEQEKCDGEALHQRQLSASVVFFVEEIKFLQVERDLMQDCFSGRTRVCKLDISSIDPIGVMDRGIETTTAEQIARGREIVAERAPKYMASRTEKGGSSSVVTPTPAVGGRSTALPSRKSSRIKKK
ncbi:hypothetical protein GIB67_013549 [Kingdonia uniflora]|uniref:Uncharacterized protein n=1 Tax=Kingdonia uniflora TaxID=39325 RepID=A0A7J7KV11_9MAGN|nr:hypothetical protein GIB67_013549 [Kingdonia uniflora]